MTLVCCLDCFILDLFWYNNPELSSSIIHVHVKHLLNAASPDGWAVWGVVVSTRWWLLVDHCVLRNWDRILVRAVKGLISRAGMVSICPLLWQRDVKLPTIQPTNLLNAMTNTWRHVTCKGGLYSNRNVMGGSWFHSFIIYTLQNVSV